MPRNIYLANVGANSSHRFLSPIFDDGTFELITIPETPPAPGPQSVRYRDLCSHHDASCDLSQWIPRRLLNSATHFDPEFETFTYGDNCDVNSRAAGLKPIRPGDLLFFIVRMAHWREGGFTGETGFYLAGFLEIESILAGVRSRPSSADLARFGRNAHIRRGLNNASHWDGFWVFAGTHRSCRFHEAVPVDRSFADAVLRCADGSHFSWDSHRSELQVIGSYTRACRRIIASEEPDAAQRWEALASAVGAENPGALDGLL